MSYKILSIATLFFVCLFFTGCEFLSPPPVGDDQPPTPSPAVNLALNKQVTVSSVRWGGEGIFAVDGNRESSWNSEIPSIQSISIDLGARYNIKQVILDWTMHYAEGYTLAVSDNGIGWTTVFTETNGNGRIDNISLNNAGRYIRMSATTASGSTNGYSLYEFEVYEEITTDMPSPPAGDELIYNSDFGKGRWQWENFYVEDASGNSYVDNGAMKFDITSGGSNEWDVQLNQGPVMLEYGYKYTVTFDAWVNGDKPVSVYLSENDNDKNSDGNYYSTYDSLILVLTPAQRTYTVDLIMLDATDNKARVAFNLGGNNIDVSIDNVSMLKKPISVPPFGSELITNGDFNSGLISWGTYLANGAQANLSIENGALKADITSLGTDNFDLQVSQTSPGFVCEDGKRYRVSFDAWADSDRNIFVTVWENGHDIDGNGFAWSAHGCANYNLTSTKNTYTYEFIMNKSNYDAGIAFFLGDSIVDFYLDNVSIKEVINVPEFVGTWVWNNTNLGYVNIMYLSADSATSTFTGSRTGSVVFDILSYDETLNHVETLCISSSGDFVSMYTPGTVYYYTYDISDTTGFYDWSTTGYPSSGYYGPYVRQ